MDPLHELDKHIPDPEGFLYIVEYAFPWHHRRIDRPQRRGKERQDLGFGIQAAMLGSIDREIGGFLRQIRAHGDALHMVNMGMR